MSDVWLQIVCLSAVLAVCAAGLLPAAPAHYSSAAAVSSQSIVRHDEHAPVAKLAVASPLAYHAAPSVAYHAAPSVAYHAAPAPVAYHAAPAHYSAANSVSSQTILRHDQPQPAKLVAPFAYQAPASVAYHSAPAPFAYHGAPVAKVLAPAHKVLVAARHEEEYVS